MALVCGLSLPRRPTRGFRGFRQIRPDRTKYYILVSLAGSAISGRRWRNPSETTSLNPKQRWRPPLPAKQQHRGVNGTFPSHQAHPYPFRVRKILIVSESDRSPPFPSQERILVLFLSLCSACSYRRYQHIHRLRIQSLSAFLCPP